MGMIAGAIAVPAQAADNAAPPTEKIVAAPEAAQVPAAVALPTAVRRVHVIPIREQIGSAVLYVVRRGIKEAIEQKADAIVFDMNTPGGALDTSKQIMEAIGRFPGTRSVRILPESTSANVRVTINVWRDKEP